MTRPNRRQPTKIGASASRLHPLAEADAAIRRGQLDQAEQLLRQNRVIENRHPDGMLMLSVVLARTGRLTEAESLWRTLLQMKQHEKQVLPNLVRALESTDRLDELQAVLQRSVELMPEEYPHRVNLASCLYKLGRLREARIQAEMATRLAPERTEGHFNLGRILEAAMDFGAASASYQRVLQIEPGHVMAITNLLFMQHFMEDVSPEQRLRLACEHGQRLCQDLAHIHLPAQKRSGSLRVGMLSADFRAHPVGWFLGGFLPHLNRCTIELVAYNNHSPVDAHTHVLKSHFHEWHDIGHLDDTSAAKLIASHQLDILIDLAGLTAGNRLGVLARKPAPVQVNWLGYFGSTGLPTMDWLLADPLCLPAGEEPLYRERIWRLPHSRFCMGSPLGAPAVTSLPALQRGRVTLGSFQQLPKINARVLALWSAVLQALPHCDLRIQSPRLSRSEDSERLKGMLTAVGIDPARYTLLPGGSMADYLAAHQDVDFILDTFPYTGGTTTCEALWMGVPTLTLTSHGMLGRQGEAHLRNLELHNWIAHSEAEFVELARHHASPQGLQTLAQLRSGLRERCRASPLFDNVRFANDWTQALQALHTESLKPRGMTVAAPPAPVRRRHQLAVTLSPPSPPQSAVPLEASDAALKAGFPDKAERMLREAHVVSRTNIPGMHLLAIACAQQEKFAEAETVWKQLLSFPSEEASVLPNLGRMLSKAGRHDEALPLLQRAIALSSQSYVAHLNLGACLYSLGRFSQARDHAQIAAALQPLAAQPHFNLGCAWEAEWNFVEAIACYERALGLDPGHQEATRNRLFLEHFFPEITPQQRLAHACQRGDEICRRVERMSHPRQRQPGPLRVGLLSADFKSHPVGWFLGGFLRHINPENLTLQAFNNGPRGDQVTAQLRPSFIAWHDIAGLGDAAVADLIARQHIDILIELSGMTAGHGLGVLARKPAPIQVSWLGYFSSIGLPTIDWVLADPLCLPLGEEALYRENVWRLPHSRFCMAPPAEAPEVNELPALSRSTVTLGCFQELTKLNDRVLRIWARAMGGMPGVRLRVQSTRLAKAEDRAHFLERLRTAGMDTSRCELVPPSDRATYLRAHHEIDFILDSFPYTGGTTTCEALWMGVPTLTLTSPGMLGRQGEAHLRNLGLDDWVAHDEDEFVERAIRHASPDGLQALAVLRSELRERCRTSPLFDNVRFAADWTQALLALHQHFLSNPPQEP